MPHEVRDQPDPGNNPRTDPNQVSIEENPNTGSRFGLFGHVDLVSTEYRRPVEDEVTETSKPKRSILLPIVLIVLAIAALVVATMAAKGCPPFPVPVPVDIEVPTAPEVKAAPPAPAPAPEPHKVEINAQEPGFGIPVAQL